MSEDWLDSGEWGSEDKMYIFFWGFHVVPGHGGVLVHTN